MNRECAGSRIQRMVCDTAHAGFATHGSLPLEAALWR